MEIKGTTVMLTGGARIGQGVALALAHQGVKNFLLTYLSSQTAMQTLAGQLEALGANTLVQHMDATDEKAVQTTVQAAREAFGSIDILLNMVSTYYQRDTFSLDLAQWRADYDANATSIFLCMAAVAPAMKAQGYGRIINFVDWTAASRRPEYARYAAYYAAKHAAIGLTEGFALEYAPEVLINSIAPGPIIPPHDLSPAQIAQAAAKTPLKRWGGAEEIAEAVSFFIRSNFVTGECLRVDGGRHLV